MRFATGHGLFQVLVIEADGSGNDGIGGGEGPADEGDDVHAIEDHSITDGETLVLADVGNAGGGRKIMSLAAVVTHRETIIITFDEDANDGHDPADKGDEREDEETNDIHGLPERVAEGEADAAAHVEEELFPVEFEVVAAAVDEGFRLLAEIGEEGGADDEEEIFE